MHQARTADQAVGESGSACSLTCDCWDCLAWRRHLLKLTVVVALACGLGGEVARRRGWWDGAPRPVAADLEPVALASWF
ncbi:MAG: hypothetical protein NDI82_09620 [Anaeromyxobacteraceae bacterium]|nr:hypothetical protein [Anaeromyxobacteraceae bacterium]